MTSPTLLLVDDDPAILDVVGRFARRAGFEPIACAGGGEALRYLSKGRADVAVVDLRMPGIDGFEVARAIRQTDPACPVILMSGVATIDNAVEATRLGAVDFLTKPFDFSRLTTSLSAARNAVPHLSDAPLPAGAGAEFCGMAGASRTMQELFGQIRRLAPHARSVLISGETGVGKELVARAVHASGARPQAPFVAVNCSAFTETLFEAHVFGHAKGAFTGAADARRGLFEAADGGTLFLDEVGDLPLAAQAKLLRVLETGDVRRVGALEARRTDVQVIAATNRELHDEVTAGRFRADLFYRLSAVTFVIPPLRDRRDDIPGLAAGFVRENAARLGRPIVGFTASAERHLLASPWEGNVRELRNTVERACLLAEGVRITERELVAPGPRSRPLGPSPRPAPASRAVSADSGPSLARMERGRIVEVLQQTGGNKMATARILGVSRRALYRRLIRYGLYSRN